MASSSGSGNEHQVAKDRVSLEHDGEWVGHGRLRGSLDRDEAHDLSPSKPVTAAVDEDPVEPGIESVRHRGARRYDRHASGERFLDGLLGLTRAAEWSGLASR